MVLNKAQDRLYVAQDNSNYIAVIDTNNSHIVDLIQAAVPAQDIAIRRAAWAPIRTASRSPPDEKTLYVTNGGLNAVAVLRLGSIGNSPFEGLISTGFYPNSVSVGFDGSRLYVVKRQECDWTEPPELHDSFSKRADCGLQCSQSVHLAAYQGGFSNSTGADGSRAESAK